MIDKRLLQDKVIVKLKQSENDWGKNNYSYDIVLSPVRFDRNVISKTLKSTRTENTFVNKPGVIFIYPKFCKVTVDESWIEAKVIDEISEYKVVGFKVNYFNGKVFSYEIEVL